MTDFERGYSFFAEHLDAYVSALDGEEYIGTIDEEISKFIDNLKRFDGYQTSVKQLKGDAAEVWHSGTFNIQAALHDSQHRTRVDRSHGLGSVDVSTNFHQRIGSKFCGTAEDSAKAQSISIFQRFREYQYGGGTLSFEEYLEKNGYSNSETVLHDPLYTGQIRLIPKDQLEDAIAFLKRKIASEGNTRPEQTARYRETLGLLTDRIKDGEGIESVPLTEKEARRLAQLAKEGKATAEALGQTTEDLVKFEHIMNQAFKAGLSSAVISLVLRTAPEIFKSIEHLIQLGEIDAEDFQKIGFAAVQGSAEGFIRGSVSAALTTAIKAGLLGESVKGIDPSVIGAVTVIVMDTMKNAFKVAQGQMTQRELANDLVRETFVSACSLVAGGITQIWIEIPVFGFMLGSFLGSMIGSFVYTCGYNAILSFCVDTGFTMFGLVEQDYKLPEEVLEQIGIDVFQYEKFEYPHFEYQKFEYPKYEHKQFVHKQFDYSKLNMVFLRRGVIGVHRIGYV